MEHLPPDMDLRLRAVRVALGLSQDRFAAALETSKTTVQNWERGSVPLADDPS